MHGSYIIAIRQSGKHFRTGDSTFPSALYTESGRPELAENELAEAAELEGFLPAQMSGVELESALKAIIEQVGAKAPSDMGKVMGVATKQLAGRADGRAISEAVKKLLQQ